MNTRLSKLVTMAQTMTDEERTQWADDVAHMCGKDSEQHKLVLDAIKQARAVLP